ncbi:Fe(3+)-hydroxamate ABC transporter permease FhuB [Pseudomonas sp. EL_65y_Pfl2_R95]|uniref:Fe(3+)-hydroxamate ABC transporter permease FhuB n=1 Tax=Pseudomonas sp. EL_65y_Pfl2_R95 TaxID=3088698 RepID=UPI0030D9B0CA
MSAATLSLGRPMSTTALRYLLTLMVLLATIGLYPSLTTPLTFQQQGQLLLEHSSADFASIQFQLSVLPRLAMALLVGAAMGLSGSVLQQLTQNRLVSPMTLGTSSGAWLGLICATSLSPAFAAEHGEWAALGGALLAVGLVLVIAGRNGIAGVPVILAGMALNILLGALAAGILLIDFQQTRGLFVWGAGDLGQIDWVWVQWLWPRLIVGLLVIAFAPRVLTLMQLGSQGAQARGLSLWPMMLALFTASIWLTSVSITAVGLIGFIGLIAPNVARLCGARTSLDELIYSTLLGMLLLLLSDALALLLNQWLFDLIPSGATAALIGAPALLWLTRRQLASKDQQALVLPDGSPRISRLTCWLLPLIFCTLVVLSVGINRSLSGWNFEWPSSLIWSLRWPRTLTAVTAGSGLAVAGVLLQRLLRNPLASPDILGISAGAALAVMATLMVFGSSYFWLKAPLAGFVGSLAVLAMLLLMGRRHHYSPAVLVLVGIALSALLTTALQLGLSKGSADSLALLGWLAGSTYRVSGVQAVVLSVGVLILVCVSLVFCRALTLISIGDKVGLSRGLNVPVARMSLLILAALLCALVTSLVGPVAFVGLLAPHIAAMLGARRITPQLLLSALLGALLMLAADWVGRVLIFPLQLPLGIVASVVCGVVFVALLVRQRLP